MSMGEQKIAFIIPTKDRPKQLKNLLLSISKQSIKPNQIIIVDSSAETNANFIPTEGLAIEYIKVSFSSLAKQRNVGMQQIKPEIDLVGFLDDDIEFEDNSMVEMTKFWQYADKNLGGACFNIISDTASKKNYLKRIFFTGDNKMGLVLRSGYNTKICPAKNDIHTQWLLGGVTIWRKNIIEEFKFDEWFQGYGLFEDYEYSYRVGKRYQLAVASNAKVKHNFLGIRRKDNFQFGKMEVINRFYFVKKNPELSKIIFLWATLGQFLENLINILLQKKKGYLLRAMGNVSGLIKIINF
jgi:glycosyltransferase involved in cell wall biosynthesis